MRGLPFPQEAIFDRETSNEYGTPASNIGDIPIDPALESSLIDPALQQWSTPFPQEQFSFPAPAPYLPASPQRRDYSQGPQGDPFAPAPPPAYYQIEEPIAPDPQKPVKKKRKPKREPTCGHCGSRAKNPQGEPEDVVSCAECGRSGHPSCMQLQDVAQVLRTYNWTCVECKICEICHEKGDDSRILFCDSCDRGWHMDCLTPAFETTPPGKWHCPACTDSSSGVCATPEPEDAEALPEQMPEGNGYGARASSVASSSRSQPPTTPGPKSRKKGKRRATATDESEDVDVEGSDTPIAPRGRGRRKTFASRKRRAAEGEHTPSPPSTRRSKPSAPKRMVVLRLPAQGPETDKEKNKSRKGKEKEEVSDDSPTKGMFDDILSEAERDTTKTNITASDKAKFERARLIAEAKLAPPPPKPPIQGTNTPTPGPSTRPLRSAGHLIPAIPLTPGRGRSRSPSPATPSLTVGKTPQLRIRTIRFGCYDIQTWYDAPFPEEYANIPDGRLWICEFCLKYMKSRFTAVRHHMKCKVRHPPGDEIYRDGQISIFEVDGRRNKIYCQNLCLLSKMFLDHKSLFYDVEPFLFYVMTEVDNVGARFVGYFSKEKRSPKDYNVSCIMTLPVRQRQGWGNLLIDFSYLLSKKEQRPGSPEKPLSGLGALGYKNYWTLAVMRYLQTAPNRPRLEDISRATCMTIEDVYTTLAALEMIHVRGHASPPKPRPQPGQSIKFSRGRKNGVARRPLARMQTQDDDTSQVPFVPPTQYEVRWDRRKVDAYLAKWAAKGYFTIKPEKLKWAPFLLARVHKTDTPEQPVPIEGKAKADVDVDVGVGEDAPEANDGDAENEEEEAGGDEEAVADEHEAVVDEDEDEYKDDEELPQSVAASDSHRTGSSNGHTRGRANGTSAAAAPSPSTWSATASSISLRPRPSRSPSKRASHSPVKRSTPRRPARSPEVPLTARRLRSQGGAETPGELPTPIVERTNTGSSRRTRAHAQAEERVKDTLEGDAALAKRLAQEEMRPQRMLRSRSSVGGGASASATPNAGSANGNGREKRRAASAGRASPKKRRRVESSPEPELEPEAESDADADAEGEPEADAIEVDADPPPHAASDTTRVGSPVQVRGAEGGFEVEIVSRQSAPSDDTVFVVGEGGAVKGTEEGARLGGAAAEKGVGAGVEGDADADAEGEDIDAEGEPDDGL